jgi:hypothetical protein
LEASARNGPAHRVPPALFPVFGWRVGRPGAALFAALWLALLASTLRASLSPPPAAPPLPPGQGDLALYKRIVERVRAGESYYRAAGDELRAGNYGVRPMLRWRAPIYAWIAARAPHPAIPRAILGIVAGAAVALLYAAFRREDGLLSAAVGVILMIVALLPAFVADGHFFTETWAAALIALSLACCGLGVMAAAVAAAIAALLFRELALGFAVAGVALAGAAPGRRALRAWLVGLLVFAAAFALHGWAIARQVTPADPLYANWLGLGGLPFILTTTRVNPLLAALPYPATAFYLSFALLGFTSWSGPLLRHAGLAALLYVGGFAFVGQPFHGYWGILTAPLLAVGILRAPLAAARLVAALLGRDLDRAPTQAPSRSLGE